MSGSQGRSISRPLVAVIASLAVVASLIVAVVSQATNAEGAVGTTAQSAGTGAATVPTKIPDLDKLLRELDKFDSSTSSSAWTPPNQARGEVSAKRIKWWRCSSSHQCGSLWVPKNWNKPRKGAKNQVKLALIRLPSTSRAKRPTLFMNPGGPGVSGTDTLASLASKFRPLRSRYNIVAWDPRGVPSSLPVPRNCPETATKVTPTTGPFNWSKSYGSRYRATVKQLKTCIRANQALSRWVGTNQVVRDLDTMRRAVGDKKLSYIGFSYGSTIGRTYQLTFPNRVRAMVLDGLTDPAVRQSQDAPNRMTGSIRAWKMLRRGLKPGVRSAYSKVTKYLQSKTITAPDGTAVTRWLWWSGLINSARNQGSIAALPVLICELAKEINANNPTCDSYLPSSSRSRSVAVRILVRLAQLPMGSPMLQLVNCADSRGNLSQSAAGKWVQRTARKGGSEAASNNLNYLAICAGKNTGWDSIPGLTKRTRLPKPPLLVNGVGDVATTYGGAQQTRRLLTGSRMIKVNTTVHGLSLVAGSRCVDRAVLKYLKTTKLPKESSSCGALPS